MSGIRTVVFHLEAGVIAVPLATCISIVASAVDGSDVIFTPYTIQHLCVFAAIIEIVATVVEHESTVGHLQVFEEFSLLRFTIGRHRLAVQSIFAPTDKLDIFDVYAP